MCEGCWYDYGTPAVINDGVRALAAKAENIDPFGGLHIVVADWNLEDENIQWCLDNQELSEPEASFARGMLALTLDERVSALAMAAGIIA